MTRAVNEDGVALDDEGRVMWRTLPRHTTVDIVPSRDTSALDFIDEARRLLHTLASRRVAARVQYETFVLDLPFDFSGRQAADGLEMLRALLMKPPCGYTIRQVAPELGDGLVQFVGDHLRGLWTGEPRDSEEAALADARRHAREHGGGS